jgi:hypothetical protein
VTGQEVRSERENRCQDRPERLDRFHRENIAAA